MFFFSFTKGNPQIHVPFSGGRKYSNRVYSSRKEFAPRGANSVLEVVTPLKREAKKGIIVEWLLLKVYLFALIVFIRNGLAAVDL